MGCQVKWEKWTVIQGAKWEKLYISRIPDDTNSLTVSCDTISYRFSLGTFYSEDIK